MNTLGRPGDVGMGRPSGANDAMGILLEYYDNVMVILCVRFTFENRSAANAMGML